MNFVKSQKCDKIYESSKFCTFVPHFQIIIMTIEKNKVVSLTYTLRDGSALGSVVEVADEQNALTFIYGAGMMLPSFEANLSELKSGSDFSFLLKAAEAYGEFNPEAVIEVAKNAFADENGVVNEDLLQLGKPVMMHDEQGHRMQARIIAVTGEQVKLDFNAPMAGKDLHFTGKILTVRDATPSEIDHGHVHGPGGHQH